MANKTHAFTLILSGIDAITPPIHNALFEAGCDDALFGVRNGVAHLDFDREAPSLLEAIRSAIADVKKASIGVSVVRIEPDDLVNAAEIAKRIHQTRESVWKYIRGERGAGHFPLAVSGVMKHSPLWRWNEVAEWLANTDAVEGEVAQNAKEITTINSLLELKRLVGSSSKVQQLWEQVFSTPSLSGRKKISRAEPQRKKATRKVRV